MPQQGKFTAADLDQPSQSGQQTGQFSAADLDQPGQARGGLAGAWDKFKSAVQSPIDIPGLPNISRQANEVKDLATGAVKNASEVSAPAIAGELYKRFTGQPNTLKELPGKMVTQAGPLMFGEPEADAGETSARPTTPSEAPSPVDAKPGVISRMMDVAKRRAGHIPGVQAVKDIDYVVRGGSDSTPAPPSPPTPSVPDNWGKGQYGTPVDQWGQKIPAPLKRGSLSQMMNNIQDQVGKGLGATPPPKPDAPIYQRGGISNAMQEGEPDVPKGHTPLDSSWLKSYKYDPTARELEYTTKTGQHYVRGDVDPDAAADFEKGLTESPGKAWNALKNNPRGGVDVAKVINGKRIAMKPGAAQ
jgi:hypothetical protein